MKPINANTINNNGWSFCLVEVIQHLPIFVRFFKQLIIYICEQKVSGIYSCKKNILVQRLKEIEDPI